LFAAPPGACSFCCLPLTPALCHSQKRDSPLTPSLTLTPAPTGYGSHAIGDCWLPAWLVGIQCILAVLLEAIFLGIIFAKISHPKGRSRTILISECACIARRDGILKL
jgi:hypothetical protein